jgi:hypothetical protein
MSAPVALVSAEVVTATIEHFTTLDKSGDRGAMTDLARRIGKEQPALLAHSARIKVSHGDKLGEAAVFYGTLVWAMFERAFGKKLPRLLPQNLTDAQESADKELAGVEGVSEKPVHERVAPGVRERQPHIVGKLVELMEEDVREKAIAEDGAGTVFILAQVVAEAFDAAVSLRRPGQNLAPIVRDEPKVGRNDPCPCGSGKKWKRCHGAAAA